MLTLCSLSAGGLLAQTNETIRVKSGAAFPAHEKYLYARFTPGVVEYHNGRMPSQALLNYNLLLREMQFLVNNRDTLSIADAPAIREIRIRDDVFVYDQNGLVLTVLADYGSVMLTVNHSLKIASIDKEGGYGMSSGASSIKTYNSYPTSAGANARLEIKGDVVYSHQRVLMFLNQNRLSFPASRKSTLRMYPRKRAEINKHLKEHPVQFGDLEQVKELLVFCQTLD